ncbi:hypothetical protein [Streptomyces sp. NPDC046862]|uniref:hypothetical protein n=1 Tax=Streptomyces sp. NPDC046862 TaxID=3154603 RepID=UPI003451B092
MLHRGIKFVHATALAFAALLAFLVVSDLDEGTVLGSRTALRVDESDGSASGEEVVRALGEFAADRGAVIGRELPDLEDSEGRRHLYLAVGDPRSDAASWLKDGYPDFGGRVVTEAHPMAELGNRDPRGFYYVFGPHAPDADVTAEFASLGLRASAGHPLSPSELWSSYADGPLFDAFLVTALALVTLTGASVLLGAKGYGVLRLQGMSLTGVFFRDLRLLRRFWLVSAGLLTAVVLAWLGVFNGWARLGLYTSVAVGIAVVLELIVLAAHAAVLGLTFRTGLRAALKGEVPARAVSLAAYAVRIPALLLVVGLLASVVAAGGDLLERRETWQTYARTGDATGIRITGSVGIDDMPKMERAVGRRIHQADRQGKIIMAGRLWLRDLLREEVPGELLVVNDSFLAEQPVLAPGGQRYRPGNTKGDARDGEGDTGDGKVRLLVPETLSDQVPLLRESTPGVLRPEDPDRIAPSDIETRPMKNGQRIFTYTPGESLGPDGDELDRSFVPDPVVLVVPNGSDYLTQINYYAFATRNQVVFPDPRDVHDILREDAAMRTYIAALLPVKQKAAVAMSEAAHDFRLQLFQLAAGTAVLLITATGVCIVHARRNAQAIFVRHLSGWSFLATHGTLLAVEAALAALLAAWLPVRTWWRNQDLAEYAARGIPAPYSPEEITGPDLLAAAGLAAVTLGVVLGALTLFHRRIVREGSSEA